MKPFFNQRCLKLKKQCHNYRYTTDFIVKADVSQSKKGLTYYTSVETAGCFAFVFDFAASEVEQLLISHHDPMMQPRPNIRCLPHLEMWFLLSLLKFSENYQYRFKQMTFKLNWFQTHVRRAESWDFCPQPNPKLENAPVHLKIRKSPRDWPKISIITDFNILYIFFKFLSDSELKCKTEYLKLKLFIVNDPPASLSLPIRGPLWHFGDHNPHVNSKNNNLAAEWQMYCSLLSISKSSALELAPTSCLRGTAMKSSSCCWSTADGLLKFCFFFHVALLCFHPPPPPFFQGAHGEAAGSQY